MSEKTKIQWATSTGNPWIGCTKVSPGCKNCYAAELDAQRFSRTMGGGTKAAPVSHWGKGAPRFRTKGFWKDALRWNRQAEANQLNYDSEAPLHDEGELAPYERPRIFPSLCDWLDEEVPIEWLADFLKLTHDCPNLDFLLPTKRPENFRHLLHKVAHLGNELAVRWHMLQQAPPNIWLGVSVEDQQRADERIPALLKIPAKVRFLSCEPLLGPLNIKDALRCDVPIHWCIAGGESGRGARPCNVEWIRSIVRQCQAADVPCFVKQMGGFCVTDEASPDAWPSGTSLSFSSCRDYALVKLKDPKGGELSEWPEDLRVREFPQ